MNRASYALLTASFLLLLAGSYLLYQNWELKKDLATAYATTADREQALAAHSEAFAATEAELRNRIALLESELSTTTADRDHFAEAYREEKDKFDNLDDQIRDISGTVGKLDKLAKTDPELLQKYSKIFFLNEHYTPPKLKDIDPKYLYDETVEQQLHAQVYPFFSEMLEDALEDGIELYVVSGFRSFGTQAVLKDRYTVTYGSGANAFSADQGYSEHQLGTTIDFTTTGINGGLDGFETTPAYEWLLENAYRYGFILSYPENNGYYIYEPWHWRFVGEELARKLHRDEKHFYDLDQRTIDQYLISLFD